jgi:hypothetical protein
MVMPVRDPVKLSQKTMAQRAISNLSEPNFLSAPEVPGTEIGAHPHLAYVNFLSENNQNYL